MSRLSVPYSDYLPAADASNRYSTVIHGTPEEVFSALTSLDIGDSLAIRTLLRLRGLSGNMRTLRGIEETGFIPLARIENSMIIMGIVGKFWTPKGHLQRVSPGEFAAWNEPGWARAVWGFVIEADSADRTILSTETHVLCHGTTARRLFKLYWRLVGPFSGVIRKEILRLVRTRVEADRRA